MSENVIIALVSASGALIVGLCSVGLNVFWMGRTFDQLARSNDLIHSRLTRIEEDMKQFFRINSEHAIEIARLKDKSDLQ